MTTTNFYIKVDNTSELNGFNRLTKKNISDLIRKVYNYKGGNPTEREFDALNTYLHNIIHLTGVKRRVENAMITFILCIACKASKENGRYTFIPRPEFDDNIAVLREQMAANKNYAALYEEDIDANIKAEVEFCKEFINKNNAKLRELGFNKLEVVLSSDDKTIYKFVERVKKEHPNTKWEWNDSEWKEAHRPTETITLNEDMPKYKLTKGQTFNGQKELMKYAKIGKCTISRWRASGKLI